VGGALQIHFGIWGQRWFKTKEVQAISNEYWTWPSDEETQGGSLKVGGYFK
jgi:hypothetical protein